MLMVAAITRDGNLILPQLLADTTFSCDNFDVLSIFEVVENKTLEQKLF